MRIHGKVSDEHGRALQNFFRLTATELFDEVEPGTSTPDDMFIVKDGDTGEIFTIPIPDLLAAAGSVDDGANVGAGTGQVFQIKTGIILNFRTLLAGPTGIMSISTGADTVTLDVVTGAIDHGALAGLADDDHLQYFLTTGARAITGNFMPGTTNLYDIGATGTRFKDLYLAGQANAATANLSGLGTIASVDFSAILGIDIANNVGRADPADVASTIASSLLLDDLANVDLSSYTTGALFYYTGSFWDDLPIGSATRILGISGGLPDWRPQTYISHATISDLTWSTAGHTIDTNFLPNSDATRALGSTALRWTNLFLSGSILDSASAQIYLRRSGADTLTGNWDAGAFTITSKKFIVNNTTLAVSADDYLGQININANANDIATVYRGAFYDIDYSQNNAAAAHLSTVCAIAIDIDLTNTATAFSGMTAQFMQGTIDAAAGVGSSARVLDLQATFNNTSYSGGVSGSYLMQISGATSSALIALKTDSRNSGSGRIVGYQGAGTALAGATGEVCGVEAFITSVGTVSRVVGLSSTPRAGGGALPANDKVIGARLSSGHLLVAAASGAFVTGTPSDLSTVSTTHLSFTANTGELYVQGAFEVDGKAWFDGDAEFADAKNLSVGTGTGTKIATATTQKLGFWNVAPVAQPSAFTQTYATATKTHANLTSATLTDSTGGTANTTVAAVAAGVDLTTNATINDNFADVVAQINALRVDLENTKQVLNAVIDDDQVIGIKS